MIDFKNLTKEQQQYLVLGALVVAGVLYGLHMLVGVVVSIDKKSRSELVELTEKIENAELALRGESKLRADIAKAGEELDELLRLMPEYGNEFIWATERVYELIRGSNIHLKSVDKLVVPPSRRAPGKSAVGAYAVRISATGGYDQLCSFLTKVENDNPLVSVREVEISANRSSSVEEHALRVDLYWPKLIGEKGAK
ncbi:GspMb/PilO family protein [Verrucomicrobiota bacterium]